MAGGGEGGDGHPHGGNQHRRDHDHPWFGQLFLHPRWDGASEPCGPDRIAKNGPVHRGGEKGIRYDPIRHGPYSLRSGPGHTCYKSGRGAAGISDRHGAERAVEEIDHPNGAGQSQRDRRYSERDEAGGESGFRGLQALQVLLLLRGGREKKRKEGKPDPLRRRETSICAPWNRVPWPRWQDGQGRVGAIGEKPRGFPS